jgi:hypothetical protein
VTVEAIVELLDEHRYSSSPWTCACGARLVNSNLRFHVAEQIIAAVEAA